MSIKGPKHPANHPDRLIDCEFAIEPAFQAIIAAAIAVGWTEGEVTSAMIGLATNHAFGVVEDAETAAQLVTARMMIAAMKGKP